MSTHRRSPFVGRMAFLTWVFVAGVACGRRDAPGLGGDAAVDADVGPDGGLCLADERPCGGSCCAPGLTCDERATCCPVHALCGRRCCDRGEICEGAACHLDCGERPRCGADVASEVCCEDGEVCVADRCFRPTTTCSDFVDCASGEYCDAVLRQCLPQPEGEACVASPAGGDVKPTLVWHWDGFGSSSPASNQVVMTPIVVELTDDDENGVVDCFDIPDVVFTSFTGTNYATNGVLRAVRGESGEDIFAGALPVHPLAQLAAADLDGDGRSEIVGCAYHADLGSGRWLLTAFEADGSVLWSVRDARVGCLSAAPSIADLDGDGQSGGVSCATPCYAASTGGALAPRLPEPRRGRRIRESTHLRSTRRQPTSMATGSWRSSAETSPITPTVRCSTTGPPT